MDTPPDNPVLALERRLGDCMLADRRRLRDRLARLVGHTETRPLNGAADALRRLEGDIARSVEHHAARARAVPAISYPPDLPISARVADLARAIAAHQVVVVAGETGSGKTTQLPKVCLALGRGVAGMIGHTQPRRLAARTVAARLGDELGSPPGAVVGYKVRFGDRTSPLTLIKVMTDGILLAETQQDRLLEQYDTIIIDEAHERSLNIDFLLGYLHQLLPRRPDLKLIITSATIDPARFSAHFSTAVVGAAGPAAATGMDPGAGGPGPPVIEVSGRTYPVEVRYRPLASDDPDELDRTQEQAVLDAVDELARSGPGQPGDVLVFLPGEREIRETAEALRKHHPPGTEILPLYARLSAEEQLRVFKPRASGVQRRIVLATNVAETSLTVPGIRAVIDTGLARISRYSPRTRVQRLPIEPVSRASADQRAGRCGRVAPGVCIRLYSEEDYAQRPPFTDPEVLRTNLASVILQMKALRLGDVGAFPFIDPPDSRLVRDGYETLLELGAVDEAGDLTSLGAKLARLPVDPRLGRMILAAAAEGCLGEMLVLAAALSVPDPRERPLEQREPADAAHAPFRDETSDFLGLLKLWAWHEEQSAKLSSSQLRRVCRQTFLSFMRLREWHDVYQQLRVLATDMGFRVEDRPCGPEPLHRALLPGLVSSVGARRETGEYAGPRGLRFWIHPGSGLHKKGPRWVVAAELVTTTRLYARTVGRVEPAWIERAAPHLVRRSHHDPHYDERSQSAVVLETVTLFGLELARGRRVCLAPLDPVLARELFIRHALVEGRLRTAAPFLELNRRAEEAVRRLEHKLRRPGLLAGPEARHDFFDRRLPPEVHSASTFESWRARAERARRDLLVMTERDLLAAPVPADVDELYPDELAVGTARFPLRYRAEPGHPDDGVTVELPLEAIGQLDESLAQWLVPGMLREKTVELIRALPKAVRVSFVPAPQTAERVLPALVRRARAEPRPSLAEALALELSALPGGVLVDPSMLREEALPPHLRLHIRVLGSQGQTLAGGRDVGAVKRAVSVRLAEALAAVPDPRWNRAGVASWDFGDLPERVVLERHGLRFESFPALIDLGTTAGLRLFRSAPEARHAMRAGLRRLLALELAPELEFQLRHQPGLPALCLMYAPLGSCQTLRAHLAAHIAERACLARGPGQDPVPAHEVRSQARFAELAAAGWHRVAHVAHEATDDVRVILTSLTGLRAALEGPLAAAPAAAESLADIRSQLDHLVPRDFLLSTPPQWLAQLPRFLLGVQRRLEKLAAGQAERDAARMPEVVPLWRAYLARAAERRAQGIPEDDDLQRFRWLLEELRISVFAQELRTSQPVSPQRLHKLWMSL